MQVFEEKLPKLSIEETFEEQRQAMISIPKKYELQMKRWIPMKSSDYPDNKPSDFPIVPVNSLLGSFVILGKSKECTNCGKIILPKPSKNFTIPEICPYCNFNTKKQRGKFTERIAEPKRSSTIIMLNNLLTAVSYKYRQHSDFHEKQDYTENFYHRQNHEIYLNDSIIQDAAEIVSCIESLIMYDKMPRNYFIRNGKSYIDLFNEIIQNESILKLKPMYDLITMVSPLIKATMGEIKPEIRYPRASPASVTNIESMQRKPTVDHKTFD